MPNEKTKFAWMFGVFVEQILIKPVMGRCFAARYIIVFDDVLTLWIEIYVIYNIVYNMIYCFSTAICRVELVEIQIDAISRPSTI